MSMFTIAHRLGQSEKSEENTTRDQWLDRSSQHVHVNLGRSCSETELQFPKKGLFNFRSIKLGGSKYAW